MNNQDGACQDKYILFSMDRLSISERIVLGRPLAYQIWLITHEFKIVMFLNGFYHGILIVNRKSSKFMIKNIATN